MRDSPLQFVRANPDVAAIALLIALLVPGIGHSNRPPSLIFTVDRSVCELDARADKVIARLEDRIRGLEERLGRAAQPVARLSRTLDLATE